MLGVFILTFLAQRIVCVEEVAQLKYFNNDYCNETVLAQTFKFVPHLNDTSKFIECVGIGLGFERDCPEGFKFDNVSLACFKPFEPLVDQKRNVVFRLVDVVYGNVENETEFSNQTNTTTTTTEAQIIGRMIEGDEVMANCSTTEANSTEVENLNKTMIGRMVKSEDLIELFNSTETTNSTEILEETTAFPIEARIIESIEMENQTIDSNSTEISDNSTQSEENSSKKSVRNLGPLCKGVGNCVNGECDDSAEMFKCICLVDFTGETCETKLESNETNYEKILNHSFCVETYINQTFSNGTVSYDELLVTLLDEIWGEISPLEEFLHNFEYESLFNGSNAQMVKLYAKQSMLEFQAKFELYEQVLDSLIDYFNTTSIAAEANKFVDEWNKTLNGEQQSARHLLCEPTVEKIKNFLNESFCIASHLYECKRNNQVEGLEEQVETLKNSTDKAWDKVIEYGFWHVTHQLYSNQAQVDIVHFQRTFTQTIYKTIGKINKAFLFKSKTTQSGKKFSLVLRLFSYL